MSRLTVAASVLGIARALKAPAGASTVGCSPPIGRAPASFESAVRLYEDGRWADAYKAAAGRADAGDPRAAKLALLMLRHGARLYGVGFTAEPLRIARWATTVLRAAANAEAATVRRPAPLPGTRELPMSPQRDPRSISRRTASPSSITAIA